MSTHATTTAGGAGAAAPRSRPSALASLVRVEARLQVRDPTVVFWALIFPVVLVAVVGAVPASRRTDPTFHGLRFIDVYVPVVILLAMAMMALNALPPVLAGYRENGVLRRYSTTPVGPLRVLAAHLIATAGIVTVALVALLAVARIFLHVHLPSQAGGFVLSVVLAAAALLAVGLLVAALAPSGRAANAVGAILFFPLMFFAGLWVPRDAMSPALRDVSDATPLGAAAHALQDASRGSWPHLLQIAVLLAYGIGCGALAVRLFRWE